jgi:hypothetical protein
MTAFSLGVKARCTDGVCGHVAAVASVTNDGIRLSMSKREISDLPAVDFRHPGQ